mmetsp:Transcript_59973/g.185940  ORF Transcript_59973/g.185940 Transcript_59973/m.185940 type:complete len:151 (+) Transcript_59973:92-544(+)
MEKSEQRSGRPLTQEPAQPLWMRRPQMPQLQVRALPHELLPPLPPPLPHELLLLALALALPHELLPLPHPLPLPLLRLLPQLSPCSPCPRTGVYKSRPKESTGKTSSVGPATAHAGLLGSRAGFRLDHPTQGLYTGGRARAGTMQGVCFM